MMRKKALGKVLNTDIGQTSTWKDFKKFKNLSHQYLAMYMLPLGKRISEEL